MESDPHNGRALHTVLLMETGTDEWGGRREEGNWGRGGAGSVQGRGAEELGQVRVRREGRGEERLEAAGVREEEAGTSLCPVTSAWGREQVCVGEAP